MTPDIVQQLKAAIEADKRTHYAIAKGAGVAPAAMYRFVDGARDISLATAAKLAAELRLELRKARAGN